MSGMGTTRSDGRTGRPAPARVRPWFVLGAVVAGALVLAGLVAFMPLAFSDEEQAPAAPLQRAARQGEVQAALDGAAAALRAGDRAAYRAALPASGRAARAARDELYARLAPLPWSSFAFDIAPIPGEAGRFDVRGVGTLGRVGPADRIGGDRVLDFEVLGRGLIVAGDATPPAVRREYLMAYERPVAVQRPGGIVVADKSWRPLAAALADDLVDRTPAHRGDRHRAGRAARRVPVLIRPAAPLQPGRRAGRDPHPFLLGQRRPRLARHLEDAGRRRPRPGARRRRRLAADDARPRAHARLHDELVRRHGARTDAPRRGSGDHGRGRPHLRAAPRRPGRGQSSAPSA